MKLSFYDWCVQNNRHDLLDRWDYALNSMLPTDVSAYAKEPLYLKCPKGIHESSKFQIATAAKHNSPLECKTCNSFAYWCIINDRFDLLERWDFELNNVHPEDVTRKSPNYYYFKCPRGIHKSTAYKLCNLTKYSYGAAQCSTCSSFAQWGIDNIGDDFGSYWDYDKNIGIDPWQIPFRARPTTSIYIKCQYDISHKSYKTFPDRFVVGSRCPECARIKTESYLEETVRKYLEQNYDYKLTHEYECSIIPYNNISHHYMPYDNDLQINDCTHLMIECHGKQHYEIAQYTKLYAEREHITNKEALARQQWRDKYKKEYALSIPGYYYLELSYKVIKDGSFKSLIDNKISYILSHEQYKIIS